jgi:hypothetical protein
MAIARAPADQGRALPNGSGTHKASASKLQSDKRHSPAAPAGRGSSPGSATRRAPTTRESGVLFMLSKRGKGGDASPLCDHGAGEALSLPADALF